NDDQWLYLPALKRVKRISSADKSGPFMGSEFAYEDLSSTEVEKYRYNYLRDESLDGEPCFVVERVPVDENSGYTKQVTWIDQSEYRMRRIDYYDRKGELLKTMTLSDYAQYLDKYWRPATTSMVNHQTGKSTTLLFSDYQFQSGFSDNDFSRDALSRVR
ncbi:MAG: outer membrane lipoprotein-sorting protein, partial [Halioglobus sp.]